jgi:hypothetical protein
MKRPRKKKVTKVVLQLFSVSLQMSALDAYLSCWLAGRARADTIMPGHYGQAYVPQPSYASMLASAMPSMEQIDYAAREIFNAFNSALAMPVASGSNIVHPSLGYHAQPMVGGMPVPMTLPVGSTSQFQRLSSMISMDCLCMLTPRFKMASILIITTRVPLLGLIRTDRTMLPSTPHLISNSHWISSWFRLQKFFDDAMDDHEGTIPVRDAAKALGLSSTTERLPGMQVPLMPHQLIGVAWMEKQELGRAAGGILA